MMLEPALITARVTSILEELGVRYLIGGSLASTIHGIVRTTLDSAIVAELRPEHIDAFVNELKNEFYIDEGMIVEAIALQSSFNIIHRDSFFKVDVFIPEMRTFIDEQFSRAQRQILSVDPPAEAFVASSEDTILTKLEWYRAGAEVSERQWSVPAIMRVPITNESV